MELADERYGIKDIISWNSNDTTSWRYDENKQEDVHIFFKFIYGNLRKQVVIFYTFKFRALNN